LDLYRIDDGAWKFFESAIWTDDFNINSVLSIWGEIENIQALGFEDRRPIVLNKVMCNIKNGISTVNIGFLKSLSSYSQIMLTWNDQSGNKKGVWEDNSCKVNERKTSFSYDSSNSTLYADINYYGKGRVDLVITNLDTEQQHIKESIKSGSQIEVTDLKTCTKYSIKLVNKDKNGLLRKDKIMYDRIEEFFSIDDIERKNLQIESVEYFKLISDGIRRRTNANIDNLYVKIVQRTGDRIFTADIFEKNSRSFIYKSIINPVEIEIISDIVDGSFEAVIRKYGKYLKYSIINETIQNTLFTNGENEISLCVLRMV